MNKWKIIRLVVNLVLATSLLLLYFFWQGVFSGEIDYVTLMKVLCDGFFIMAALYLAVVALQFVSSRGEFDSFRYGIKTFFHTHKPSKNFENSQQTYADYVIEKNEKRRFKADIELYIGLFLLTVSIVLLILYKFSE